ncbi:hypothetical protein ABUK73_17475 [Agrobacterium sp. BA1120]|uniref:hypothetical protein n=1 Tax=Agrobacterium sp. BA1120 TaxID=3228927 RepID=UPI00336A6CD0
MCRQKKSFGFDADKNLGNALAIVTDLAEGLGIDVSAKAKAELEAHTPAPGLGVYLPRPARQRHFEVSHNQSVL